MTDRELIEKYPWLRISNRWTGEYVEGAEGTELDLMPSGWRKTFGEKMCEEINDELMTWPQEDKEKFRITDIKEKWAHLCFYTNFTSPHLNQIIGKYSLISRLTCIHCGGPARWITRGWYMPYCQECAEEQMQHINNSYSTQTDWGAEFIDIDEYYKIED